MDKTSGYRKAVDHFGGVVGLAKALDIERQAVYMWKGRIPKARAFQIESITDGKLTAAELLQANGKRRSQQEARV